MENPIFPPSPTASPEPRNTLAVVSLAAGIAAIVTSVFTMIPVLEIMFLVCLSPIFGTAALVTGLLGLKFARKNRFAGQGQAITGLVLGAVSLALFLVFGVSFVIGLLIAMA